MRRRLAPSTIAALSDSFTSAPSTRVSLTCAFLAWAVAAVAPARVEAPREQGWAPGRYEDGRWIAGPVRGRYGEDGRWIAGEPAGRIDAAGLWRPDPAPGYWDDQGRWRAGAVMGEYDEQGHWRTTAPGVDPETSAGFAPTPRDASDMARPRPSR